MSFKVVPFILITSASLFWSIWSIIIRWWCINEVKHWWWQLSFDCRRANVSRLLSRFWLQMMSPEQNGCWFSGFAFVQLKEVSVSVIFSLFQWYFYLSLKASPKLLPPALIKAPKSPMLALLLLFPHSVCSRSSIPFPTSSLPPFRLASSALVGSSLSSCSCVALLLLF